MGCAPARGCDAPVAAGGWRRLVASAPRRSKVNDYREEQEL